MILIHHIIINLAIANQHQIDSQDASYVQEYDVVKLYKLFLYIY